MRSELDVLLDKIEDPVLRANIAAQVQRLHAKRSFGLVFESHLPERVRLSEHPIKAGVKVAFRDQADSPAFEVLRIERKSVSMRKVRNPNGSALSPKEAAEVSTQKVPIKDVVVIAGFGQPIFPGLRHLESVRRGSNKPAHVVIKGENHHVLEALQFTHSGKIDCIYIDPPYNSGARDWKYDNNYVDENDDYRHSKWLAFMERRLRLAKELLNPERSVLIVTIDEKEYLRLGLLLGQVFPGCNVQMTTIVINPKGTGRPNEFSRVDEYAFFVFLGDIKLQSTGSDMLTDRNYAIEKHVRWRGLARTGRKGLRSNNPGSWYPIFLKKSDHSIHSIGDAIEKDVAESAVKVPKGTIAVWPPSKNGHQYSWSTVAGTLRKIWARGGFKTGNVNPAKKQFPFYYLSTRLFDKIATGEIVVTGRGPADELITEFTEGSKSVMPRSVWNQVAHDAGSHGTNLLQRFAPGRTFPFPKSLYAVEDAIRFFVKNNKKAVVLDFFGGSGTTTHAVARLNRQDDGQRQSILITNNEVSAAEADALRARGKRPGDPEWEALGIFDQITLPRIKAAITGRTFDGNPVEGDYKVGDVFPMAHGFEENVEFFELMYLDPEVVELDIAFSGIAPLLWLRSGGLGSVIYERRDAQGHRKPYEWTDYYGVLFNPDRWRGFVKDRPVSAKAAFIVTDSQTLFAGIAAELPGALDVVRLYENYVTTFAIKQSYSDAV